MHTTVNISAEQIERVELILSSIPGGVEKAITSVIRRANSTVRSEALKGITGVYAITKQNVRAETTITEETRKADGGIVGFVTFASHKIPLYRFDVSPTLPGQRATVTARTMKDRAKTPFEDAFIAQMESGHVGVFRRDKKTRLPIYEFPGLSTEQMVRNTVVLERVEEKAQEVVNTRIEHEITRILNGYGT